MPGAGHRQRRRARRRAMQIERARAVNYQMMMTGFMHTAAPPHAMMAPAPHHQQLMRHHVQPNINPNFFGPGAGASLGWVPSMTAGAAGMGGGPSMDPHAAFAVPHYARDIFAATGSPFANMTLSSPLSSPEATRRATSPAPAPASPASSVSSISSASSTSSTSSTATEPISSPPNSTTPATSPVKRPPRLVFQPVEDDGDSTESDIDNKGDEQDKPSVAAAPPSPLMSALGALCDRLQSTLASGVAMHDQAARAGLTFRFN